MKKRHVDDGKGSHLTFSANTQFYLKIENCIVSRRQCKHKRRTSALVSLKNARARIIESGSSAARRPVKEAANLFSAFEYITCNNNNNHTGSAYIYKTWIVFVCDEFVCVCTCSIHAELLIELYNFYFG